MSNPTDVDFVSVRDEPLHRKQFSNEHVWVYRAGIGAGCSSLFHEHAQDTLYICLRETKCWNHPCGKPSFLHEAKYGEMWWAMAKADPYVHKVEVPPEENETDFVAMEVLEPAPAGASGLCALPSPFVHLPDLSNHKVTVLKLRLGPGEKAESPAWGCSGVLLSLTDGVLSGSEGGPFQAGLEAIGAAKWVEDPAAFSVVNSGTLTYEALVVQWKSAQHGK
ncbi:unnamed protein product [Chrysoparadoxa australica]